MTLSPSAWKRLILVANLNCKVGWVLFFLSWNSKGVGLVFSDLFWKFILPHSVRKSSPWLRYLRLAHQLIFKAFTNFFFLLTKYCTIFNATCTKKVKEMNFYLYASEPNCPTGIEGKTKKSNLCFIELNWSPALDTNGV